MCPGLTNPGSEMPPDGASQDAHGFDEPGLNKGQGVMIYAEGKEYALGVGALTMNSSEM